MARKAVKENVIPVDPGVFSEPLQSRMHRENPVARLLFSCSSALRFKISDEFESYHNQDGHNLFSTALPFWTEPERHTDFIALTFFIARIGSQFNTPQEIRTFRNPEIDYAAVARSLIWLSEKGEIPLHPALADQLRAWTQDELPAGLPVPKTHDLVRQMLLALPSALDALHREELPQDRIDTLLGEGRDWLCNEFGLSGATVAAIESDPELCLALTRLTLRGNTEASELLSVSNMASDRIQDTFVNFLLRVYSFPDGPFHEPSLTKKDVGPASYTDAERHNLQWTKILGSRSKDVEVFKLGSALILRPDSHLTRYLTLSNSSADRFPHASYGSGGPLSAQGALRMATFALSASGAPGERAREALLLGTSTGPAFSKKDPWAQIGSSGDFSPWGAGQGYSGVRRPGTAARGSTLREVLRDFRHIFDWRNPSRLFTQAGFPASIAIGSKILESALSEATGFVAFAPTAMALALYETALNPAAKRAATSALAERFALGFAELGSNPDLDTAAFFPGFERPIEGEEVLTWKAGELAGDPMGQVSLTSLKVYGLAAPSAQALVGEAKRALGEQAGLSNAAWRALSAAPELRKLFMDAARNTLQLRSQAGRKKSSHKEANAVMKQADLRGDSARARTQALMAREAQSIPLDACARTLSAGVTLNMPQDEQALMLQLIRYRNAYDLAGFMSGRLPCLPRAYRTQSPSLTLAASCLPLLIEDAQAIESIAPAMLKGLAARHKKNIAESQRSHAQETGSATYDERVLDYASNLTVRDFSDVLDCAKAMPPGFWTRLDTKNPLSHARRMHAQWVRDLQTQGVKADSKQGLHWEPLVHRDTMGKLTALELTSGRDLFDEGTAMHHCVGSYADACHAGTARLISLRDEGARQSTLELAPHDARGQRLTTLNFEDVASRKRVDSWKIVQHRGKCNAHLSNPALNDFALLISERASSAFARHTVRLEEAAKLAAEARKVAAAQENVVLPILDLKASRAVRDALSEKNKKATRKAGPAVGVDAHLQ